VVLLSSDVILCTGSCNSSLVTNLTCSSLYVPVNGLLVYQISNTFREKLISVHQDDFIFAGMQTVYLCDTGGPRKCP